MKKTLITLLALAGVSAATPSGWICDPAATVKDKNVLVSGTSVHVWDVSAAQADGLDWTGTNALSVALTLDVATLDSTKDYAVMSVKTSGAGGTYNGLASIAIRHGSVDFILWNDRQPTSSVSLSELNAKSSLTLVLNRNSSAEISLGVYADGDFDNGRTLTGKGNWTFSGSQVLSFGGSATNYYGNVNGLMPSNANAAQFTLLGAAYMTGGVATTADLKTYYLLPEPSTACLSLLALAGLAARRRRR